MPVQATPGSGGIGVVKPPASGDGATGGEAFVAAVGDAVTDGLGGVGALTADEQATASRVTTTCMAHHEPEGRTSPPPDDGRHQSPSSGAIGQSEK